MENLINVQTNLKASIERAKVNFKKSPKERLTLEYVETRLANLEHDWNAFRTNHSKLLEGCSPTSLNASSYITNSVYDDTEEVYIDFKTSMKVVINKLTKIAPSYEKPRYDSGSGGSSSVKLPKITIPTFSGKYDEWPTFRDLFLSLIHKNGSIDAVQKLHYLKGHLTGEAEQLIRHTPITGDNYDQCWRLLEQRYDNKKYLCNTILKRLFGQKRLPAESSSGLKELLDTTTDCLSALKNLKIDVTSWDVIIIHIVTFKLDIETRKQWELNISSDNSSDLPTLEQFKQFMESRFRALECLNFKGVGQYGTNSVGHAKTLLAVNPQAKSCEYCSEDHKLSFCKQFAKLDHTNRRDFVIKRRMCFNCLGGNHLIRQCDKSTVCRICGQKHHSLLHFSKRVTVHSGRKDQDEKEDSPDNDNKGQGDGGQRVVSCLSTRAIIERNQVLLATAVVRAQSRFGNSQLIRALLDQGSQASFVTEDTVQLLQLKKHSVKGVISGLGTSNLISKYIVIITIQSLVDPSFKIEVKAYVLKNITSYLPDRKVQALSWIELKDLKLADPQYNRPNKIDILLGAEVYGKILKEGFLKAPSGSLIAQHTTLGWVLSGSLESEIINKKSCFNNITVVHAHIEVEDILKKFWEIEEVHGTQKILTQEEQRCEEIFKTTTTRAVDGRYVVRLPFREDKALCVGGKSYEIAANRFKVLERRFKRDSRFKDRYTEVINEYLHLGHMKPIREGDVKREQAVYLPHHAVIREDKSTTKVRVVFDASCKNGNGVSLNDSLLIGPTLQPELRHTILRWRVFPIGIIADIVKMYRQVQVSENDTRFQRIVWRDDPEKDLEEYELVTVTFGTGSAPYLAVRALHQTVNDEGNSYPLVKDRVFTSFYMDDLMTGCYSLEEGMSVYKEMSGLLRKGGFQLQKWNSNNGELVQGIMREETRINKTCTNEDLRKNEKREDEREIKLDESIKTLGITWKRIDDVFTYSVQLPMRTGPETKRTMISDIARIYDPMGWIAPTVIIAKMFIQGLWLTGINWDDDVPISMLNEWHTYRNALNQLQNIQIPRWIGTNKDDISIELHGFCDASKLAYAAVVYARVINRKNEIKVSLVAAKTKVAPIKQKSIPRLELCGAWLLAQLLLEVADVLNVPKEHIKAWTDSTIVLAWLSKHPSHWKTFVANRVSDILCKLDTHQWAHVSTKDNPADCASRGLQPSELLENKLWFSGPKFLKTSRIEYDRPACEDVTLEAVVTNFSSISDSPWCKYSTLNKLLRVVAYCRRFLTFKRDIKRLVHLTARELNEALECCIRLCQQEEFNREIEDIKCKGTVIIKNSKIKSITPYLDSRGIVRVGGRLQESQLTEETKHPVVLPHNSHLTQLLIADAHEKTLHGGPRLMMTYLRTAYWILGVKGLAKNYVRKCVKCMRYRATAANQLMGSLPSVRVTQARAFCHSGVDYAGPINIRATKGRGHRAYKGYICLFVCLVTKAVHLEIVSDMTTQGFLAAFRRFVSRRGHCAQLWSDNGTNFVGAARELQQILDIQSEIAKNVESFGTEWHFIPPHAPNFGGIWEAGIKSTKFHLKRVIGDSTLTFEEMTTLLSQIEACLNSRPLTMINSSDPGESVPLTPSHFLIGEPIVAVPDTCYELEKISCLSRWQVIQKMLQSFWRRWSQEYLTTLVNRYKWNSVNPEPKVGDIVLIKEDDLPPSRWLLGRILQKHPGPDNLTRVVSLRTKTSVIKRPVSKLCILPIDV